MGQASSKLFFKNGVTSGITVYPNPSSGKFTISSKSAISSVEVYNLLGELVYSDCKFSGQKSIELDLSNRSKGVYVIRIFIGKEIYNTKLVIQ